jgi:hypothetical protein
MAVQRTRILLLAMAAAAAVTGPANAAPMSYDCDTAPGRYSELKQTEPGPAYRVSGRIAANELAMDKRWVPVGNIVIESADGKNGARLRLFAPTRRAPLDVVLSTNIGDKVETQTLGQVGLSQELAFSMTVADGRVKVEIGTMRGEAAIEMGAGASVGVTCSTGNFHFDDLRLSERDR